MIPPPPRWRVTRRFIVAVLAWAGVAAGGSLSAGPPSWRLLETPRCTVVSQLPDRATRAWAGEFNQFVAELSRVFQVERQHLPALTVVLFARDRDFAPYKPLRPDGREAAAINGFFNHHGSWSVIGLAYGQDEAATRELIFHEGVHWFTSTDPVVYPVWLDEGLAEVFSTFRQERRKVRWGTEVATHVARLRTEEMLPFERLLYTTRDDPLFNGSHRTGIFYAQSWVFVHYLMFGEHDGSRHALADYVQALNSGTHADEAFRRSFGHDYERMAGTLANYIQSGRYYKVTRPEAPAARITTAVVPASPAVVEVALARLALAAQRDEIARPHADRAIALAPDHPGGFEMLAQLHAHANEPAAALAACARAEALGSQDARTLFQLAYLRAAHGLNDGDLTAHARTIADLYRRAIAANPTMTEAYQNLAALAPVLEQVEPEDIATLQQGARLFPQRGEIVLGLASLAAHRGDRAMARHLIAAARQRGLPVGDERRAQRMLETWQFDESMARINTLSALGRYDEALAAYDALIPQMTDIFARGSLMQNRQALSIQARFSVAEEAVRRGDFAVARTTYEQMLADPTVSAGSRRIAEINLQRLPASAPRAAP